MWNCIKCNARNDDQVTICSACGAARSAGRFGMQNPAMPNTAAYTASVRPSAPPMPPATPQIMHVPDFSHIRAGRGMMLAGAILSVTLPLLVALLAIFQYDALCTAVVGLLIKDIANAASWLKRLVYIPLALLAMLISALPGLWTLSIGKMLRRLARMEELL